MPYTLQPHKLFEAAARDPEVAKRKGISMQTAAKMAHEGVKKNALVSALKKRQKQPEM